LQEFHRQVGLFHEFVSKLDESLLWSVPEGWTNSAGVLARHLAGNVHQYVGADVLSTGYVRDREAEFRAPPVDKSILVRGLEASLKLIEEADKAVTEPDWISPRIASARTFDSLALCMASMASHASYHLGQASVLARLLARPA